MARTRNLQVIISGDANNLNKAFGQVEKHAQATESKVSKFGKATAVAFAGIGVAAGTAAVVGLKKSVDAAVDAQRSQVKLQAQLKASGISYRAHAKEIDNVIQKTSKLAGLDDEDLQDAFTAIVRTTGSVNTAMKDMALVADLARAKHMDVAKAGELVAKIHAGNVGPLKRLGLEFVKSSENVDKLKESNKKYTPEQLKAAQAADKQADSQRALGLLQSRLKGTAAEYGKSTAGSMDRASVAFENLQEVIGAKLLPILGKAANAFANLIDESGQLAGPIKVSTGRVADSYKSVTTAVSRFVTKNRASIDEVIHAARNLSVAFKAALETIAPIAARVLGLIAGHFARMAKVLADFVGIAVALINGDWKKAWHRAGTLVKDFLNGMLKDLEGMGSLLFDASVALGKLIVKGIVKGMGSLGHAILGKVKDAAGFVGNAISKLNPFGDGVGKALGDGAGKALQTFSAPMAPGGGLPSLMGANAALAPVAGIASKFGLRTSSGRRPGAITSSGNVSYHSTGEALDEAGSPAGMMRFFQYMRSRFGPRLAELIYTPGGVGIKDGHPFRYTGAVAADHFDHVHVAIDTGRPGVGDGLGQTAAAAARKAGFSGSSLVTALAVADAESGFHPARENLKYPDHSIGLWQINQLAHHGRYGSDAALHNPVTNAKAAYAISGGGRNWGPWSTFTNGAYKRYLSVARALVSRTPSSGSGGGTGAPRVLSNWGQDGRGTVASPSGGGGYIPGMGGIDASGNGVTSPDFSSSSSDAGNGIDSSGAGSGDVVSAPTWDDIIGASIAEAALTPGTEDDAQALGWMKWYKGQQLGQARASGDPRAIKDAAEAFKSASDAVDQLNDTINQANQIAQARQDLDQELVANQRKILAMAGQGDVILQAVIAAVSGGIGGKVALGYQTPGYAGGVARY